MTNVNFNNKYYKDKQGTFPTNSIKLCLTLKPSNCATHIKIQQKNDYLEIKEKSL